MSTAPSDDVVTDALAQAKPPFLRRVQIRGYKSIAFCDVTLEPLTILVGRNASGKSNFLDALAFLRDVMRFGVNGAVDEHGGVEGILCQTQKDRVVSITIECEYPISGDAVIWHARYRFDIELLKTRPAKPRLEELRIEQGHWWTGFTNQAGNVTFGATADGPFKRVWKMKERPFLDTYGDTPAPEFLECLEAITTYNFNPEAIRLPRKPTPGRFLKRDGSNLASVIETTCEIEAWAVERVGRYLLAITKTTGFHGVLRSGGYETLRFHVSRDGNSPPLEFPAASMSDGTLRAFAALVAAFQMVPPHGSPSIVGIEEPETSLHPSATRALVDALDEATLRTQILLTTHSADLLDNPTIKPENVRVVQMIDGRTVIGPVDEASVEIVARKLSTLGGLERENQLEPDLDDQERQRHLEGNGAGPLG
ncbi:MAG: AAA family ATPase [Gemmataceae bacterium]